MGRLVNKWENPKVGDYLEGVLLFFFTSKYTLPSVFIRSDSRYFSVPPDAAEQLLEREDLEGRFIRIEKSDTGYTVQRLPQSINVLALNVFDRQDRT